MKPPPNVPPPASVQQAMQRPAIEPAKKIIAPAGPPPGVMSPPKRPADGPPDQAAPKKPNFANPPAQQKAGGVSMFEGEDPAMLAARLKAEEAARPQGMPPGRGPPPRGFGPGQNPLRAPRPMPPRMNPPGIPDGQPLPPDGKPLKEGKAPAPTKPPPKTEDGGRAPPKIDPEEERRRKVDVVPPTSEPPLLRIKKAVEPPFVKRRDRDMPEFESSDDDEENPNMVKQPLPFGVLKQAVPTIKLREDEEEAALQAAKQAAAAGPPPGSSESVTGLSVKDQESVTTAKSRRSRDSKPKEVVIAPPVAPAASKTNEFVPAAPVAVDKFFDDSNLGKTLSRGRLLIKCIEGLEIRRKDDQDRVPRNDPFIKFRLGVAERHPWKSSQTKRKQDSHPVFDDEIISFDILDPAQYIFQEDIQLCIELWNKGVTRNDLIGSVTMSIVRFLKQPFVSYTEKVPIYYPGVARTPMRVSRFFDNLIVLSLLSGVTYCFCCCN